MINNIRCATHFKISRHRGRRQMGSKIERPYRKNLKLKGLIYFGGEEQEIIVKNLSLTGLLAELKRKTGNNDIKTIFNNLKHSTTLDIYLPDMENELNMDDYYIIHISILEKQHHLYVFFFF